MIGLFALVSAVVGVILGAVAGSVLDSGEAGVITAVAAFLVMFFGGLPAALKASFIHNEVAYLADRADLRQMDSDRRADLRDRGRGRDDPPVTYDNRQIHFHGGRE